MLFLGLILVAFVSIWQFLEHIPTAFSEDISPKGDFAVIEASPDPLEAWLDRLITYENCPWNGVWDNKSYSYGPYCYKEGTYLDFMRRFADKCMPFAEENEWLNNLSDLNTQRCLTRAVILADKDAYKHWLTSTVIRKGLGKPPVIYLD